MNPLQIIRKSFSTQLSLWVAGFVLVISATVLFLLARFSEEGIHAETIETTMQALENVALRIDNTLRQSEMTAQLEHKRLRVNRSGIERLIDEEGALDSLHKSLPNAQIFVTRRDSSQLDTYITGSERGYRQLVYEEQEIFIFSQPVGKRHYSLAVVCPAADIHNNDAMIESQILLTGGTGVFILLYIIYLVIARHLRPLHYLADAAESIADGNLSTPIPPGRHHDEIGRLQNSLMMMQNRLTAYMDEMQQKQTTLSRQNTELQAAYGKAQAYEVKKRQFLHDMTLLMKAPVSTLCNSTETVCLEHRTLTEKQMNDLQSEIMKSSETITQLLDKLIKAPAAS